ncbi:hypothetical protein AB0C14_18995 [Microbispora hainanensis]|uniref:hypothetical protein n=1 Tax=Microbispora hainanensis TaxID=568844 RepID=UPI0033F95056
MLQSLRRDYAGTSAFFYLDVSLPETLRRHGSRPQRSEFTPDQMREWYRERDLLPDAYETVIGEDSPLEATVRQVLRQPRLLQHEPVTTRTTTAASIRDDPHDRGR